MGSSCRSASPPTPDMPIIFITGYGDVPMSVRAMKAGAVEFLTKPSRTTCCSTRSAVPSSAAATALERGGDATLRDCYASLTPREREVMALVALAS